MNEREAFRLLASADRQLLLHELIRADGALTEEELSRRVAARRHQLSLDAIREEQVERAHVRLAHHHLPVLRDVNVVDWDDGEVAISDDERTDQLLAAAEMLEEWPPDDRLRHNVH